MLKALIMLIVLIVVFGIILGISEVVNKSLGDKLDD